MIGKSSSRAALGVQLSLALGACTCEQATAPGEALLAQQWFTFVGSLCVVFTLALIPSWFGFERSRGADDTVRWAVALVTAIMVIVFSLEMYFVLPLSPSLYNTRYVMCIWVPEVLAAIWLLCIAPAVVRGVYYLSVPLPLEQSFRQALAEGRMLSAEEIMAATHEAMAGKQAWQLRVMQAKARAFAESLRSNGTGRY